MMKIEADKPKKSISTAARAGTAAELPVDFAFNSRRADAAKINRYTIRKIHITTRKLTNH